MHTSICKGTTFIHNGDLSGDVNIVSVDGYETRVPRKDVIEFVVRRLIQKQIGALESMDIDEAIGYLTHGAVR